VADLARPYVNQHQFYIVDIERNEEEETSYDAVTNLNRS